MPSAEIFVRLLPPIVSVTFSLSFRFFSLALKAFVWLDRAPPTHTSSSMYVYHTWGLLGQKLAIIIIFRASSSSHMHFPPYVPFLCHYMHRYDLSFGQAGLPGSCAYALRSR